MSEEDIAVGFCSLRVEEHVIVVFSSGNKGLASLSFALYELGDFLSDFLNRMRCCVPSYFVGQRRAVRNYLLLGYVVPNREQHLFP